MSKILFLAAGVIVGYKLHDHRHQSIEKIANAVTDSAGRAWTSATDYVRTTGTIN